MLVDIPDEMAPELLKLVEGTGWAGSHSELVTQTKQALKAGIADLEKEKKPDD